jgi:diadenosine tetraphosphate (Ap4A) HIT family hydrolase
MSEQECVFCRLINSLEKERKNLKIVYESGTLLAFYSTMPFAEVHIVITTKEHIPTIFDFTDEDSALKLEIFAAVRLASEEIIKQKGACKVEMYLGDFQQAKHVHCHVIYDSKID